jgi:glyoxylase-like metal-dependent hydrolase (beta-lactamase superfamily II)
MVVLGGGLDHLYPAENRGLFARVVESGGGLLSEVADDRGAAIWSFPRRNRIVAALGEDGYKMIEDFKGYFEAFSGMKTGDLAIKKLLRDGDVIDLAGIKFNVIKTPGHSRGSVCLFIRPGKNENGVLFSGDTLFAGTYGRTDIPGGNEEEMTGSIKRLMELPNDTVVYPGHGAPTKISEERKSYA